MRRAILLRCFCFALSALLPGSAGAAAVNSLEYAVKATFLYKFGLFVDWPPAAFASNDSPVQICAVGTDPVTTLLDSLVAGQKVGARPIVARHLQTVPRDAGCQILYVAQDNAPRAMAALVAVKGLPVLTVTDAAKTAGAAGMINFVLQDNRVRFDIDAAAANGLAISSRLLSLARAVRPPP